jgi:hypothetical protein
MSDQQVPAPTKADLLAQIAAMDAQSSADYQESIQNDIDNQKLNYSTRNLAMQSLKYPV